MNFKSALPTADVRWSKQSVATRKWLAGLVTAGSAIQQHQHDAGSWVALNSDLAKTLGLNPAGAKSSGVDLASWQAQLRAATETAVQSRTESERASQGEARLAEFVSVVGRDVLGFPESLPAPNSRWSTKTAETEAWLKAWNEALNKRLESSATYRQWYAGVGEDLYRKGDNAGAVRVFTDILKVEPRESNALGNRGTVLLIQGKVNEAIADFEQSLAVNPDNASVHFALAWAYAKNRVEAEARRHYDRAVELDPVWKDRPDPTRVFVPAGTQLPMPALSSLPMSLSSK